MSRKLTAVLWVSGVLLSAPAAGAQTGQGVPAPWQWTDVGAVGTPGEVHRDPNRDWFVSGAGSDIWGTGDSFVFVFQPIRDGIIGTTVVSETDTHRFAKAGVMIRQTLDPGSPQVILDVKPDGGIEFMMRASPAGETTFIGGGTVPVRPDASGSVDISVNVNLNRSGNTVSASYCLGTTCIDLGRVQFPAGDALAGIAVTSHDPSTLNHAFFGSTVSVFSVPFPWGGFDVGVFGFPVETPGHATYEDATGTFFISGAGSDIWGPLDSFYTVSRTFFGDTVLTARVVSEEDTHPFAKAGLIMGDFGAGARRVILDVKPDGGLEFMARTSDGTSISFIAGASAFFPVWLRLSRRGGEFTGEMSADGEAWTTVGSVTMTMPTTAVTGFAVTSHDPSTLNTATVDNVGFSAMGVSGQNLLVNAGFEDSVVPNAGPGWVSDTPFRQSPAVSETSAPRSGSQNGACRTTSLDCGIYQEVTSSEAGSYGFSVYVHTNHPGALIGVNLNGTTMVSRPVQVGGYQIYSMGFFSNAGDVIRVWMYAPAGFVAIDDAILTLSPR